MPKTRDEENRPPLDEPALRRRIESSLDRLLEALTFNGDGPGKYSAVSEPPRFADRIFGGQLIGQALRAAACTVEDKPPHSLHAYFVETGSAGEPLSIEVQPVRDGRSVSTRRVEIQQAGRTLLSALASFHTGPDAPLLAPPPPDVGRPTDAPLLQEWAHRLPAQTAAMATPWVDSPPPLELRIGEAPSFFGGPLATGPRTHWLRLPREIPDDGHLHASLLAYASDYLMMDVALRSHPEGLGRQPFLGVSVDHSLWFHRPIQLRDWHAYTLECHALNGHRALVRGLIHDEHGHLVASTAQEVIVRPMA